MVVKLIKFPPAELNLQQAVGKSNLVISLKSYQPSNLVPCYHGSRKRQLYLLIGKQIILSVKFRSITTTMEHFLKKPFVVTTKEHTVTTLQDFKTSPLIFNINIT